MYFFVATPTRNSIQNLKRCVSSVQTALASVEGVHFVQDAVSSDGTSEWLSSQSGLRFKSEPDSGMYDAINTAWSKSPSQVDVFSWLNSDEQYQPDTLVTVERLFAENPDVDVIVGDYIVVDIVGRPICARRDIGIYRFLLRAGLMNVPTCATFYRASLFKRGLLNLNSDLRFASDLDLALKLSAAKVRWLKVDRYFSTFGFDGTNLSCSPNMLRETQVLVAREGLGSVSIFFAKLARVLLRLVQGCYRRVDLSFYFFESDVKVPKVVTQENVGSSYSQRG